VAVGFALWYSSDGINWSAPVVDPGPFLCAAYNDSGRVVGMPFPGGNIMYSDNNGAAWTDTTVTPGDVNLNGIAYGNNRFVAVGEQSLVYYSADGASWNTASIPRTADGDLEDIAFGKGRFVVVIGDETESWHSEDGINWTKSIIGSGGGSSITFQP
jgi:photosystem II stability/assembly factor-like uncharacterized protein